MIHRCLKDLISKPQERSLHLILLVFAVLLSLPADAAVTGEWNFKFGDLRATIGSDLQYLGATSNATTFPSLNLNGFSTPVMAFGALSPSQGFYMRHGAKANGGGQFVNQYTLLMDVMFPLASTGHFRALFQTDPLNPPGNDAEFYIGDITNANGLGANGQFSGTVLPNIWYRLAFAVDLTDTNGQQLIKYINGVPVGVQSLPGGIDGRYALGPTAQLFTTGLTGAFTQPGFVSSIQFVDSALSAEAIAALGGPNSRGIPPAKPSLLIAPEPSSIPSVKLSWNGRSGPFQIQTATNLLHPTWLNAGNLSSVRTLTLPAPFYELVLFQLLGPLPDAVEPGMVIEPDFMVSQLPGGEESLPTKQIIHTPGQSVFFGGRPVDLALSPDGQTVYVKDSIRLIVITVTNWKTLEITNYPGSGASVHGIAVSHDGSHVYITGALNELYEWTVTTKGFVNFSRTISLPPGADPCGLALTPDDATAYVCLSISNSLAVVNLAEGSITQQIKVGIAPWDVVINTNATTAYVSDWGGRVPTNGDLTGPSAGSAVVVDNRGIGSSGVLSVVDLVRNQVVAELPTGLHPSALKLSADESRLYVANANSDTVTVINTQTKSVQETIATTLDPRIPPGSAPGGLALSSDGATLYVANGGNNALAVVQLPNASHTNSLLQGFIPVDWYPGAVVTDASNLYIANVKGIGPRSGQPTIATYDVFNPVGSANKIPLPASETLDKYTAQVQENGRLPQMLLTQAPAQAGQTPVPVPRHVGEPSVFQHVLYIIKENKTYDIMFGDLPQGNGNSNLCIFPRFVSPNHHALADQFVLLDNYYCNGVQSTDGHAWCTEANANDYLEKSYGGYYRSAGYGGDALAVSASGFIWNNVLQHGLTFHNYGELEFSFPQPSSTWLQIYADYTNHTGAINYSTYTLLKPLQPYSTTNAAGYNLGIPDQVRADAFLNEFQAAQSNGVWPDFTILYLPGDHTSGSTPGFPTPSACVADNDLALGRVIQAVTQSRFWSNTVVFVIEDDPLSSYDHVDGHRSICLVVSPYTKRGQTVSTFYNQTGLVHTMEQIMGLPPMNQMDALSPLMTDCFTTNADYTPYLALPTNIPLNTMNPGTFGALSRKDRYWASQSLKQDFSKPDLADDNILNRIIWYSVRGDARYPAEFTGAHGKGLKKLGLMLTKNQQVDPD